MFFFSGVEQGATFSLSLSLSRSLARSSFVEKCMATREEKVMAGSGTEGMASEEGVQASLEKKYGGIAPKKKPLISKGSGRAFFDSADWALCKQGAITKVATETLRPKLQPTPHQQLPPRRPTCRSVGDDKAE